MWLLFQQSYYLLLWWVLIAQTQYRNMDKGCEGSFRKVFHNSWKLRKAVAIYKTLILSNKYLKKVPGKR